MLSIRIVVTEIFGENYWQFIHIESIFSFFSDINPTAHIFHLADFYKIAGAIIYKFYELLIM